jgi:hypothetical protein
MSPMTYMIGIHKKDFDKVNEHLSSEDKAEPIIVDLSNKRVSHISHNTIYRFSNIRVR